MNPLDYLGVDVSAHAWGAAPAAPFSALGPRICVLRPNYQRIATAPAAPHHDNTENATVARAAVPAPRRVYTGHTRTHLPTPHPGSCPLDYTPLFLTLHRRQREAVTHRHASRPVPLLGSSSTRSGCRLAPHVPLTMPPSQAAPFASQNAGVDVQGRRPPARRVATSGGRPATTAAMSALLQPDATPRVVERPVPASVAAVMARAAATPAGQQDTRRTGVQASAPVHHHHHHHHPRQQQHGGFPVQTVAVPPTDTASPQHPHHQHEARSAAAPPQPHMQYRVGRSGSTQLLPLPGPNTARHDAAGPTAGFVPAGDNAGGGEVDGGDADARESALSDVAASPSRASTASSHSSVSPALSSIRASDSAHATGASQRGIGAGAAGEAVALERLQCRLQRALVRQRELELLLFDGSDEDGAGTVDDWGDGAGQAHKSASPPAAVAHDLLSPPAAGPRHPSATADGGVGGRGRPLWRPAGIRADSVVTFGGFPVARAGTRSRSTVSPSPQPQDTRTQQRGRRTGAASESHPDRLYHGPHHRPRADADLIEHDDEDDGDGEETASPSPAAIPAEAVGGRRAAAPRHRRSQAAGPTASSGSPVPASSPSTAATSRSAAPGATSTSVRTAQRLPSPSLPATRHEVRSASSSSSPAAAAVAFGTTAECGAEGAGSVARVPVTQPRTPAPRPSMPSAALLDVVAVGMAPASSYAEDGDEDEWLQLHGGALAATAHRHGEAAAHDTAAAADEDVASAEDADAPVVRRTSPGTSDSAAGSASSHARSSNSRSRSPEAAAAAATRSSWETGAGAAGRRAPWSSRGCASPSLPSAMFPSPHSTAADRTRCEPGLHVASGGHDPERRSSSPAAPPRGQGPAALARPAAVLPPMVYLADMLRISFSPDRPGDGDGAAAAESAEAGRGGACDRYAQLSSPRGHATTTAAAAEYASTALNPCHGGGAAPRRRRDARGFNSDDDTAAAVVVDEGLGRVSVSSSPPSPHRTAMRRATADDAEGARGVPALAADLIADGADASGISPLYPPQGAGRRGGGGAAAAAVTATRRRTWVMGPPPPVHSHTGTGTSTCTTAATAAVAATPSCTPLRVASRLDLSSEDARLRASTTSTVAWGSVNGSDESALQRGVGHSRNSTTTPMARPRATAVTAAVAAAASLADSARDSTNSMRGRRRTNPGDGDATPRTSSALNLSVLTPTQQHLHSLLQASAWSTATPPASQHRAQGDGDDESGGAARGCAGNSTCAVETEAAYTTPRTTQHGARCHSPMVTPAHQTTKAHRTTTTSGGSADLTHCDTHEMGGPDFTPCQRAGSGSASATPVPPMRTRAVVASTPAALASPFRGSGSFLHVQSDWWRCSGSTGGAGVFLHGRATADAGVSAEEADGHLLARMTRMTQGGSAAFATAGSTSATPAPPGLPAKSSEHPPPPHVASPPASPSRFSTGSLSFFLAAAAASASPGEHATASCCGRDESGVDDDDYEEEEDVGSSGGRCARARQRRRARGSGVYGSAVAHRRSWAPQKGRRPWRQHRHHRERPSSGGVLAALPSPSSPRLSRTDSFLGACVPLRLTFGSAMPSIATGRVSSEPCSTSMFTPTEDGPLASATPPPPPPYQPSSSASARSFFLSRSGTAASAALHGDSTPDAASRRSGRRSLSGPHAGMWTPSPSSRTTISALAAASRTPSGRGSLASVELLRAPRRSRGRALRERHQRRGARGAAGGSLQRSPSLRYSGSVGAAATRALSFSGLRTPSTPLETSFSGLSASAAAEAPQSPLGRPSLSSSLSSCSFMDVVAVPRGSRRVTRWDGAVGAAAAAGATAPVSLADELRLFASPAFPCPPSVATCPTLNAVATTAPVMPPPPPPPSLATFIASPQRRTAPLTAAAGGVPVAGAQDGSATAPSMPTTTAIAAATAGATRRGPATTLSASPRRPRPSLPPEVQALMLLRTSSAAPASAVPAPPVQPTVAAPQEPAATELTASPTKVPPRRGCSERREVNVEYGMAASPRPTPPPE